MRPKDGKCPGCGGHIYFHNRGKAWQCAAKPNCGWFEGCKKEDVKPFLNMFDLLGFVPEELESFETYVARADETLEKVGVEDFLRMVGHDDPEDGSREDFTLGILLGGRILEKLDNR